MPHKEKVFSALLAWPLQDLACLACEHPFGLPTVGSAAGSFSLFSIVQAI